MTDLPRGSGPLAQGGITGGPIDDPTLADHANPRWDDPTSPVPDGQPLTNRDGSPDVLPPRDPVLPQEAPGDGGTLQDPAARELEGQLEAGIDNIVEGRGGSQSNPALAEGGET
jgi:hypothetical protein